MDIGSGAWGTNVSLVTPSFGVASGSYCIQMEPSNDTLISDQIPVIAGELYEILFTIAAENTTDVPKVFYKWVTTGISSVIGPISRAVGTAQVWERQHAYKKAPSTARFLQIELASVGSASNNVYFDSIDVRTAPHFVHAYRSSSLNIPDSTLTTVVFNTENDPASLYNTGTGVLTLARDGTWDVFAGVRTTTAMPVDSKIIVEIWISGVIYARQDCLINQIADPGVTTATGPVDLVKGDTIQVKVYQNSGGNMALDTSDRQNFLRAHEIGRG